MIRTVLIALVLMAPATVSAQDLPRAEDFLEKNTPIFLRDALLLALQHNLDLQVARTEPAIAAEALRQAKGVWDPTLFASYAFEHEETPTASSLANFLSGATFDQLEEDEWNATGGLTGILPWGITYSSTYNNRRLESNSPQVDLFPEWRASWLSEVRVPLLKDLIYGEADVSVKRSRLAQDISNEEFRRKLTDLIVQVEEAYWALASARAEERVTGKSLQTAEDLLEQTEVQYEVGVVSKVSVTQAEAGVAERERAHIVAINRAGTSQDRLLNLILAPGPAQLARTELTIAEPAFIGYEADLDAALDKALRFRPEIAAARQQVEDAEIQLAFAKNQRLPDLDLVASYTTSGLSGSGSAAVKSGSESANDEFFRHDGAKGYSLGGEFSIPLPNTSARGLLAQRKIELRRAQTNLKQAEQGIVLEVREAVRGLGSAIEFLEAAERGRIAAEETLRAEQEKLRLGDSTPFQVLEFEEDLAEAERAKIFALKSYRDAISLLERGQATLLTTRGISVKDELVR